MEDGVKRTAWLLCAGLFLAALALAVSPVPDWVHGRLLLPLSIQIREGLGKSPQLSDRLKLLAVDARTVAYLGRSDMNEADWSTVLRRLVELKPRAILVDKVFGVSPPGLSLDMARLAEQLGHGTALSVGAFVQPEPIRERVRYPVERLELLRDWLADGQTLPASLRETSDIVYGPAEHFHPLFSSIGDLGYEALGRVRPVRLLPSGKVIRHLSLHAASSLEIQGGEFRVNGVPLPLGRDGLVTPNLVPTSVLWKASKSILSILTARGPEFVKPGDTVLVMTQMTPGSVDFVETAGGRYPGGFVIASLVNSVLTHDWIRRVEFPIWLTGLLFAGLTAGVWLLSSGRSLALATIVPLCLGLGQLTCLVFSSIEWNVSREILGGWLIGVGSFLVRANLNHQKMGRLRRSLQGVMDSTRLEALMQRPDAIAWKPSLREVTVLFIDMAGFSLIAESRDPAHVYDHLKGAITRITETVHDFGGVVDRTLGDGVLAFFGYDFTDTAGDDRHPSQGLRCAGEIQRRHLTGIQASPDGIVHPLRIGVNTGSVFVGDLGDRRRVDFTIVGHAVNFAQRLETACDDFHVLCSAETHKRVLSDNTFSDFRKKWIAIKHAKAPVLAYQFDPVVDLSQERSSAITRYREALGLQRADTRTPVPSSVRLGVTSSLFDGTLADFSLHGIQVRCRTLLGRGILVNVCLPHGEETTMEVRWAAAETKGYVRLGLRHVDPNPKRLAQRYRKLRLFVGKSRLKRAG